MAVTDPYGRRGRIVAPEPPRKRRRRRPVPKLDDGLCWLHGAKTKKSECQACIANFESDRDQAALDEVPDVWRDALTAS